MPDSILIAGVDEVGRGPLAGPVVAAAVILDPARPAAINASLNGMRQGGYVSDHDVKVAKALAWALCGGDLSAPQWVTEQYILDLEWEQSLKLAVEPKTQERIMAMLQTGKPLRN